MVERRTIQRVAQSPARLAELRASLSAAGNEIAALGDDEVLDELA